MAIYGDYVSGSVGTSEAKVGSIDVPAGSRLISLTVATQDTGAVLAVRLDWAGVQTPKKFLIPQMYSKTGTPAGTGVTPCQACEIPLDEPLTADKTINIYAIADTASTTVYVGLKWVK